MLSQANEHNMHSSKEGGQHKFLWSEYLILVVLGLFGVIAALPSAWSVFEKTAAISKVPVQLLAVGQLLQSTFWLLLAVGVGLLLAEKTGLGAPILRSYIAGGQPQDKLRLPILSSILPTIPVTIVVVTLDRWFFIPRMPGFPSAISQLSGWQGLSASFYGGLTEEIITRLFFVTLLAWILSWLSHTANGKPSSAAIWIAIVGSAVLFGLGHLPATLASTQFSVVVLVRAVLLNGLYGILFGYLYWKRGLESSMLAHFTSDLLVHVIVPAFVL